MKQRWTSLAFFLLGVMLISGAHAADQPFLLGGDISALSELEKLGAMYQDNGKPGDAITILRKHGCNIFRLRLFVNPNHDFDKNYGATQDLPMVLALSTRIKNAGGKISLTIHYSDTWADPGKQFKPAAWKDLPFDQLQQKVTDYTAGVMQAMKTNGTPPEIVEVGNETTNGMLWPDGKLDGTTDAEKTQKWDNYAKLEKAGIAAVRSELPGTKILIHVDSGGRTDADTWFFSHLKKYNLDFDIMGLSFYPTWGDSLEGLKKNLTALPAYGKDILLIEAGYPYKPRERTPATAWPMTPAGQKQFLDDLIKTLKAVPDHRGIGVVWWYPEAVPVAHHQVWENGSLGWFDEHGNLLPVMSGR